ncbi:MAG: DUF3071 domain-containing protein [Bifidobacteriaceae bacterium]|jgi:hypothetical protein|nr:DUF3071 domain-containing protein [Bifidobacteriaceae bacterium]
MNELTFGRADGDRLICVDESGAEFALGITEELKAAVNQGPKAEPSAAPLHIPEVLRPKDIQALVRAGADPADLAEASGLDLDHINRYAAPVLDERAFVVGQALALGLRHDPEGRPLVEAARQRLAEQGIDLEDARWDATRQPQGWVVTLESESGPISARWQVDLAGRSLSALNEQAQWVGRASEPDRPIPPLRHLSAVPGLDPEPDADDPLADPPSSSSLSLLDGLMEHRGLRSPVASGEDTRPLAAQAEVVELRRADAAAEDADADQPPGDPDEAPPWLDGPPTAPMPADDDWAAPPEPPGQDWEADEAQTGPIPPPLGVVARPAPAGPWPALSHQSDFWGRRGERQGALFEQAPVESRPYSQPSLPEAADDRPGGSASGEPEPSPERAPTRSARSQAKRSSVPSWDEIVFGSSKTDQ